MTSITSWGRLRAAEHSVVPLSDRESAAQVISSARRPALASGMQRSYGDVSTNAGGTLWDCRGLDKFIAFDEQSGVLRCESGVLLRDIQATFSARGWMLPVTPGTAMVTVGGAIANDVHGKNHQSYATFGNHVVHLTLVRTDGDVIECSPQENPDWFSATVGGLGLTGVILTAAIQMKRVPGPWIDAEDIVFESISDFFELSDASEAEYEHTVSWLDVTTDGGRRGIFTRGNPVAASTPEPRETRLTFPITPPASLVNRLTLPAFNRSYFRLKATRARRRVEHYGSFFYPLDSIGDWNRMYGPKGFYQYQSVIPRRDAEEATRAMLAECSQAGAGSFLGVLKTFGDVQSLGMLSFPEAGVTFALDFPEHGEQTEALFARLDSIVRASGGRLYAAKDARMPRDMFERGYPQLERFLAFRDPGISSELSRRLLGS
ncbi:MAG: FAD-binding oxidoreductase [Acidobacteria bacterium]|nr:FAD-binding oxidoreductase [Acidobacteriota bacterium]